MLRYRFVRVMAVGAWLVTAWTVLCPNLCLRTSTVASHSCCPTEQVNLSGAKDHACCQSLPDSYLPTSLIQETVHQGLIISGSIIISETVAMGSQELIRSGSPPGIVSSDPLAVLHKTILII